MNRCYTKSQITWLKKNYPTLVIGDLTKAFNKTFGLNKSDCAIKSALTNRGIKCGRQTGNPPGTLRLWTSEQLAFIAKCYREMLESKIAVILNNRFDTTFTTKQVKSAITNHRLLSGRNGQFSNGDAAWNKGLKGVTGFSETRFKPGNKPQTWLPVGSERLNKDGYLERKVADPRTWRAVHLIIWEEANGVLPEGMMIKFIDGNRGNIVLENLEQISRVENMLLNSMHYSDLPDGDMKVAVKNVAQIHFRRIELGE